MNADDAMLEIIINKDCSLVELRSEDVKSILQHSTIFAKENEAPEVVEPEYLDKLMSENQDLSKFFGIVHDYVRLYGCTIPDKDFSRLYPVMIRPVTEAYRFLFTFVNYLLHLKDLTKLTRAGTSADTTRPPRSRSVVVVVCSRLRVLTR